MRNVQVKAAMPVIALVAIYKNFQEGTGKGLAAQDLAHALKLPAAWVAVALEGLEAMGYVVQGKSDGTVVEDGVSGSVVDPYFPAYPPASLPLGKVKADLAGPLEAWLQQWRHELAIDLPRALAAFDAAKTRPDAVKPTLAEILGEAPPLAAGRGAPA
jgi:hypothetical protein